MGKKIYTSYVDVLLRCGTTTSGPVGGFEFDYAEDAVTFGCDLLRRLDLVLMDVDEVCGVHYEHIMKDYVKVYIDMQHSDFFDSIVNVCQVFDKSVVGSTVVEFPYGY